MGRGARQWRLGGATRGRSARLRSSVSGPAAPRVSMGYQSAAGWGWGRCAPAVGRRTGGETPSPVFPLCGAGKVGCVVSFFPSLCPRRDRRGGALSTCTVQRAHIGLDTLRPGTDPLWGGIGGDTAAILLGLKLYTSFPFLHRYITLIAGSHHLISQAGWNRCNLSIYLSIFSISLAVLLSCGGRRVQVLRRWQQPELRVTRVVPFIPSQLEQMCDSCLLLPCTQPGPKDRKDALIPRRTWKPKGTPRTEGFSCYTMKTCAYTESIRRSPNHTILRSILYELKLWWDLELNRKNNTTDNQAHCI